MKEANSVLETGSGPANGVPIILESVRSDCRVTATDISPGFLKILCQHHSPRFTSLEANIENLPFRNDSFDRYISNMAIHNAANPKLALTEAFRVLSSDGILGVSTFGAEPENNTYMELMKEFRKFINLPYHSSLLANFEIMGSPDTFRRFVLGIGFSRVISFCISTVYPYSTPEEAADLYLSFGPFVNFSKTNPDKTQQLKDLVHEKIHETLIVKGKPIGYQAVILIAFKN